MDSRPLLKTISIAILALCACGLGLSSCTQAGGSWYPSGTASIALSYESSDTISKSCSFTVKLTNSGQSKISQSSVSVSVETDAHTYYKSLTSTDTILPGGSIYIDGKVAYATLTETLKPNGVTVVGQFYQ
jgi:outer membrane lipoprotein-sorting protein